MVKKPLGSYEELLGQAEKYINMKEARRANHTMKGPTARTDSSGKGNISKLATSKQERYKSFPTKAPGRFLGVMMDEHLPKSGTTQERAMEVCERHQVLQPEGYVGSPLNPRLGIFVSTTWNMSIPVTTAKT